jgi:hypothetical protein
VAGQSAGVVAAKVAALTEGMVKAMFVTRMKSVLAVVLVVGLAIGGPGVGVGLSPNPVAVAQQPGAKTDDKAPLPGDREKKAAAKKPAEKDQNVLTPEEAIEQMPKENVTVQFKVAKVEAMHNPAGGFGGPNYYIYLSDGGKFTARMAKTADQIMKLGIEPVKHFSGKVVRVTGRVEPALDRRFRCGCVR